VVDFTPAPDAMTLRSFLWYLSIGTVFGYILTDAHVVFKSSIEQMFRFEAFHMYGIIGSAVVTGALFVAGARRFGWFPVNGPESPIHRYPAGWKKYLFGGTVFGMGWAMTGACPAPLFALVGAGYTPILIAILGALLGTFVYGCVRSRLPH
jgi:uncharacterized membrane protein YedE/YeeE